MEYKEIELNNYKVHLIKTDRFKTINVSIKFTKKLDFKSAPYYKLLERLLTMNGTKTYPSINDLSKHLESLYDSNIGFNFTTLSNNMVFSSFLTFINPKYTDKTMYKECFTLYKEVLTKPLLHNNQFTYFEKQKETLIENIKSVKDNLKSYSLLKFYELFYKDTVFSKNNLKDITKFKKIDSSTLYKYYKELFTSFKIDVVVLGDYDEEEVLTNIKDLLKNVKTKNNIDNDLYLDVNIPYTTHKDTFNSTQSSLLIGLTTKNLTDYERNYSLVLYNMILGSMNNSILFVNVREKNSLCYYINSAINKYTSTIVISSGVNKTNAPKAIELIKKSLQDMKDEKKISTLIDNAKKTINIVLNDYYDNSNKIMDYYFTSLIDPSPTIEEKRTMFNKVTPKDIVNIANKIETKLIYIMEGTYEEN